MLVFVTSSRLQKAHERGVHFFAERVMKCLFQAFCAFGRNPRLLHGPGPSKTTLVNRHHNLIVSKPQCTSSLFLKVAVNAPSFQLHCAKLQVQLYDALAYHFPAQTSESPSLEQSCWVRFHLFVLADWKLFLRLLNSSFCKLLPERLQYSRLSNVWRPAFGNHALATVRLPVSRAIILLHQCSLHPSTHRA